jgi:hypothetical protein
MPQLSVSTVVPTYNRAHLLERALRSALAECRPGDEIIVVDDGSSDDTEAIVRALGPTLRYLRTPHLGAGAARNAGVQAATGDLVAFLDSDDEWAPGKLAWQRAVMEQFPDILYLFSDFGGVDWSGERRHNRISSWRGDERPWAEVLGPAIPSQTISGLPPGAPRFDLHVGRFYDAYLRDWCVYTCTVVARREQAAGALRFAEDLATYEDVECFARLAQRGLAGYMTCETAWQHGHTGTRLTDADQATCADAAITIVKRVWGADPAFLGRAGKRRELEAVVDGHRARKARALLAAGQAGQARLELARCSGFLWSLYLLTFVPGGPTRLGVAGVRLARALRDRGGSACLPDGWSIVEHRGREAFEQLAADWDRLCDAMPQRTAYQACAAQRAYAELLMDEPDRWRCLVLRDAHAVRAICPLEARTDDVLGPGLAVWGVPWHPHLLVSDVICPEDDARRVLVPALAEYLRREPAGGRLAVLGPLPAGSVLWDGLRRLAPLDYCLQPAEPCDVFDCGRPFDELMARLSKHFRRNLRAHRKKLASFADVRFVTATGDGLDAAFETFIAVEASGWKGASGVGSAVALHPHLLAFYRRLAANTRDRCEINLLVADGRCLAAQFCVVSGEQYSILKIGYDEAYARIGPGLLLLETTLERCCTDPAIKRMSLVTDGAWQRDWRPDVVAMQRVYLGLGRWSARPLVALLDLRFGPARALVTRVRERRAATRERRAERASGPVKGDS